MELIRYNPKLRIRKTAVAWRYMNYKKLLSLIRDNEIYFARLDQFDDPLEGMSYEMREFLSEKRSHQYGYFFPDREKYLKDALLSKAQINFKQGGSYASCWYVTQFQSDESNAMWSLYSDSNAFSISMPYKILKKIIAKTLKYYIDAEINTAMYGMVEYLGRYKYAMKKHGDKQIVSAFVKSPIFTHEQELRFLLFKTTKTLQDDRVGIKIRLNESLKDYAREIRIVSHPEMDIETHNVFKDQINSYGFQLFPSDILTKNNTAHFINDYLK